MPEETVAASSPAEVEDVFQGQNVSLSEFSKYRQDGELPARFKPAAESEPADTQEETEQAEAEEPEPEPESDPDEAQEPKSAAGKRIKQLLAKTKELERKLAEKTDVKTEPSTAKPTEAQPQHTRPKPTADDKKADGTSKFDTYEDFVEDLADWKAEQRMETAKREQAQQDAQKALESQMSEVRSRYKDADAVINPIIKTLNAAKLPPAVHEAFGTSPQFFDLCYDLGSNPEKLEKFLALSQADPRAAVKQILADEDRVGPQPARDDKGKFASQDAPEAKKTGAPKPPSPVNGASSRAFDVSDESLSADEWMRKRNHDIQKKRG